MWSIKKFIKKYNRLVVITSRFTYVHYKRELILNDLLLKPSIFLFYAITLHIKTNYKINAVIFEKVQLLDLL